MATSPRRRADEELELALTMAAELSMSELWRRLLGETLNMYSDLQRQGMMQAEIARRIEAHLSTLSTKPEEGLARSSSTIAYGEGRAREIVAARQRGEATFALRTEIMDEATCDQCATLDGAVVEIGSSDFVELKPPAKCRGGHRCRGAYVALSRRIA